MIAKVPLFSELEAGDIADIMRLLRAQTVDPGAVITRRGDPAHSMYFIAAGEVEIALKDRAVRLGPGQLFGEVAVLRAARAAPRRQLPLAARTCWRSMRTICMRYGTRPPRCGADERGG
jgi:CRP-like cAMP-binding protein